MVSDGVLLHTKLIMWNKTKVSEILKIEYPILQGPFGGGISSPELVAAVSNTGGLGGYGAYQLTPQEIEELNVKIKSKTNKPYAINLWVSDADDQDSLTEDYYQKVVESFRPYFDYLNVEIPPIPAKFASRFEQQVEVLLRNRPPVFSFVFGIPAPEIINECKKLGIKTIGTATTLEEALALEESQVDLIVASGFEAGGHRPSFLQSAETSLHGTFALVQLLAKNLKTPIIAAGGITDAESIKAAFKLGASAVQIGTGFLVCEESNINEVYRKKLASIDAQKTTLTKIFTGRLARGIVSEISELEIRDRPNILPFPLQTTFMSVLRRAAIEQNRGDLITFWAGQSASLVKRQTAGAYMESLVIGMSE